MVMISLDNDQFNFEIFPLLHHENVFSLKLLSGIKHNLRGKRMFQLSGYILY